MKYFGIRELIPCVDGHCRDKRCGVDESTIVRVPSEVIQNAIALVEEVLDPLRARYGKPIKVTSGYRCPVKNAAVGGVANSQHTKGEAADICPVKSEKLKVKSELDTLARLVVENGKWDQMILYPTFLHVSWKRNVQNRKQILRKVGNGYIILHPSDIIHRKEVCYEHRHQ